MLFAVQTQWNCQLQISLHICLELWIVHIYTTTYPFWNLFVEGMHVGPKSFICHMMCIFHFLRRCDIVRSVVICFVYLSTIFSRYLKVCSLCFLFPTTGSLMAFCSRPNSYSSTFTNPHIVYNIIYVEFGVPQNSMQYLIYKIHRFILIPERKQQYEEGDQNRLERDGDEVSLYREARTKL